MPFESTGESSLWGRSPGGFEFGVQGWVWGQPKPTSITFFLDGTAMVCDQYGRQIRRAVTNDGQELRFADTPPEANREGGIAPRPHFADHRKVIAALAAEGINWLAYQVVYTDKTGQTRSRGGFTLPDAIKMQERMIADGARTVAIIREIVCAGWPQLPYAELKALGELPPTPIDELRKIPNSELRRDALKIKREIEGVKEKEMQDALAE